MDLEGRSLTEKRVPTQRNAEPATRTQLTTKKESPLSEPRL